jgi:uncharacterized membrane protein YhaH (DUF805 family)
VSSPYNPQPGSPGGYGGPMPGGPYMAPGYDAGSRGYLQGGPVPGITQAVQLQLQNVLNFEGRASLSAYWWYVLAFVVADIAGWIVMAIFTAILHSVPALVILLYLVFALALFAAALTSLSVSVRRLHDSDKSGWLLLLGFIPFLGGLAVLILTLLPGTPGPNRFG